MASSKRQRPGVTAVSPERYFNSADGPGLCLDRCKILKLRPGTVFSGNRIITADGHITDNTVLFFKDRVPPEIRKQFESGQAARPGMSANSIIPKKAVPAGFQFYLRITGRMDQAVYRTTCGIISCFDAGKIAAIAQVVPDLRLALSSVKGPAVMTSGGRCIGLLMPLLISDEYHIYFSRIQWNNGKES